MSEDLLPPYHRRDLTIQPQLSRSRQAFRSPRSSEKLNLESEQLRLDIAMLRAKMAQLELLDQERFKTLQGGFNG